MASLCISQRSHEVGISSALQSRRWKLRAISILQLRSRSRTQISCACLGAVFTPHQLPAETPECDRMFLWGGSWESLYKQEGTHCPLYLLPKASGQEMAGTCRKLQRPCSCTSAWSAVSPCFCDTRTPAIVIRRNVRLENTAIFQTDQGTQALKSGVDQTQRDSLRHQRDACWLHVTNRPPPERLPSASNFCLFPAPPPLTELGAKCPWIGL